MKRINKGPEFLGRIWIYVPLLVTLILSIIFADEVAKYFKADSLAPAIPVVILMTILGVFFYYNFRRNN